ncbi:MAG TPA: RHS repeat-associated core domain-containing protein [Rhizomicrobium sp.]|jgi:RHS repeat-associated protein
MGPSVTPYVDHDYIMADGKMVAIVVTQNSATTSVYYPVLDHLGSVSVIVDGNRLLPNGNANPNWGHAIDRYSYDAWGEARDPSQWTPRNCSDGPQPPFTRGFTGQEHIPNGVCLINFNARIYDPAIGRFLSADPTVEAPYNPQDLNRYSYVLNNPLGFTDPSGLCFLGCFWQQSWFAPALDIALVFVGLPWLETLTPFLDASGGVFAAFDAVTANTALLVANAGIAGGIAGYAATGKIGGALISAGSAAAFAGLVPTVGGGIGTALGGGQVANAAGYLIAGGMVGGLTSVINHQNFTSGFLSGGVGSLAGPLMGNTPTIQGAVVSSVLGGFAAVLGGGKFANGAMTAAFAYAASWRAEDKQITASRGSGGTGTGVGQRYPLDNPGAAFATRESAAAQIEGIMNPISITLNTEYDWLYYQDPSSALYGFSDPYNMGLHGGGGLQLPLTINGNAAPSGLVLIGMGHTHGAYSDEWGHPTSRANDYWSSDHFSIGGPNSDMWFMQHGGPNGTWNFFTVGTPSGNILEWTPQSGVQPLPD